MLEFAHNAFLLLPLEALELVHELAVFKGVQHQNALPEVRLLQAVLAGVDARIEAGKIQEAAFSVLWIDGAPPLRRI